MPRPAAAPGGCGAGCCSRPRPGRAWTRRRARWRWGPPPCSATWRPPGCSRACRWPRWPPSWALPSPPPSSAPSSPGPAAGPGATGPAGPHATFPDKAAHIPSHAPGKVAPGLPCEKGLPLSVRVGVRRVAGRLAAGLAMWGALAASAAPGGGAGLTRDFPDTEVPALAAVMAELLERPIVVDPRAKGRLSLRTGQPVSRAQALALFAGALRSAGLTIVDSAGVLKVMPEAEAKLQAGAAAPGLVPRGDPVLTQVFRLSHESAAQLVAVLRPLVSPNNTINVSAGNNALVVTDYASNLQRIGQLIAPLDTPGAVDVEVIPLQHAVAGDLAALVNRLLPDAPAAGSASTGAAPATGSAPRSAGSEGAGSASGTAVLAHASLNALLVRAPNPARLAAVRALVARLDQPGVGGVAGSQVHVIHLRHVEATRLAAVLRAAFSPEALRSTVASQ